MHCFYCGFKILILNGMECSWKRHWELNCSTKKYFSILLKLSLKKLRISISDVHKNDNWLNCRFLRENCRILYKQSGTTVLNNIKSKIESDLYEMKEKFQTTGLFWSVPGAFKIIEDARRWMNLIVHNHYVLIILISLAR